jgi:phenylalanine-4-hydroxylase
MSFRDCTVKRGDEILFQPEWGIFDMGVGAKVTSVFTGAADKGEYENGTYISPTTTISNNYTDKQYIGLYQKVRNLREGSYSDQEIHQLFKDVKKYYPNDWLLSVELYELVNGTNVMLAKEIKDYLVEKAKKESEYRKLIYDGIELIEKTKIKLETI